MTAVAAALLLLASPGIGAPRCAARLVASDFPDPRLARAADRHFRSGGSPLRLSLDGALKPGGYALEVRADGASVAASDAEGAFRGLVEAARRCRGGRLAPGSARGSPAYPWRGVLEGFYGRPWSWAERRDMAEWMSRRRMNLLVIAPKDDPGLREEWRRPMGKEEREELSRLAAWSRERFVEVAWTLSPGLDLDGAAGADRDAASAKLEAAAAAGVRKLILAFDDVEPSRAQVRFADRLLAGLAPRLPGVEWTFVPAQYWGEAAPSPYLSRVARQLDSRFNVGWTGGQVLARRIGRAEAGRFREYARHRLVLGDNYPVQDRLWGAGRLHWGPLTGREPGLEEFHAAYVANASPLAAASRLPLATAAEYAWAPRDYDPAAAWGRALAEAGSEQMARFAAYNASSWLAPAGPPGLSGRLEALAPGSPEPELRGELRALSRLRRGLDAELASDPALRAQLEPWAAKLETLATAALAAIELDAKPGDVRLARDFSESAARADALPAVVGGQALDRFVHRTAARLAGLAPPDLRPHRERVAALCAGERGAELLLSASLDRLVAGVALVESAGGDRGWLWRDALPWAGLLSDAAERARTSLDGKGPGPLTRGIEERAWRWSARRHFVALAASRTLLEDWFLRAEGNPARALPWTLRAWLAVARRRSPSSLPVALDAALEAERRGDPAPLRSLLEELASLPVRVRARLPGQLAEEGMSWLDKVGDYGRLGLLALAGGGGRAGSPEWEEARYRLRSSNGLELMLELKLELDALASWARSPKGRRPACPEYRLPADPRDML